jgi:hypothetical protein
MAKGSNSKSIRNGVIVGITVIAITTLLTFTYKGITAGYGADSKISDHIKSDSLKDKEMKEKKVIDSENIKALIILSYEIRDSISVGNSDQRKFREEQMRFNRRVAGENKELKNSFEDIFGVKRGINYYFTPDTTIQKLLAQ